MPIVLKKFDINKISNKLTINYKRLIIKESSIELFQIFVDMTLSHEFEAPELGRPETGKSSSVVLSERKILSFEERVSGSKTTSKPTLMSTSTSQQVVV